MKLNHSLGTIFLRIVFAALVISTHASTVVAQNVYQTKSFKFNYYSYYDKPEPIVMQRGDIWSVPISMELGMGAMVHQQIEVVDTAIIHICANCTLTVHGYGPKAGIHVPAGKVLIISGEQNSCLRVFGGDPIQGETGFSGKQGTPKAAFGDGGDSGEGGRGGSGGAGGGAAIGGNGGEGGRGGAGARAACISNNGEKANGIDGYNASNGQAGEGMGVVYVVGDVHVEAYHGHSPAISQYRAPRGENAYNGGWFRWRVYVSGGGGGGNGHGGEEGACIGGGGPGGGGGGGGGSGAVTNSGSVSDHYPTKGYSRGIGGWGGGGSMLSAKNGYDQDMIYTYDDMRGGYGGHGGECGRKSDDGQLRAKNLTGAIRTSPMRYAEPIDPSANIMRMRVTYSGVNDQGMITHLSYPFYYGMNMSKTTPVPTRPNGDTFTGFYYNDTQIYDAQGQLTQAGERLLYTYNHVRLDARWVGPAHVHLELRYAEPNPALTGTDTIVYSVDTIFPITNPKDSMHVVFHASDYCPHGYQVLNDLNVDYYIHMGEDYRSVVRYGLKDCTMRWIVPTEQAGLYSAIQIPAATAGLTTDRTDHLRYWQSIQQPKLHFDTDEARLRTRFVAWEGMPAEGVMDTTSATATLRVALLQHALFVEEKEAHGQTVICENETDAVHPDSCYYGEALRIKLVPDPGYRASTPMVNQWVGEVIGAAVAVTRVNDTVYTFFGDSTDLVVTPRFEREDYHMTVDYTVVGEAPADPTVHTYAAADPFQTPVPAEQLVFHYADYVGMTSWYEQDAIYEWLGVPVVVNTRTGDTIPVVQSMQKIAHDGQEEYYLCYLFQAPASDVAVHMTMYHRAAYQCQFYNYSDTVRIDSVQINFNTQTLPADSIVTTRELDIVSMSVQTDSSAVEAGYWDEEHVYHRMPVHAEAELTPTGEYKMCYYSTIAPAANMAMGVVDGLKIRLMYCDTVVRWMAPGAALAGDTVAFRVMQNHPREVVSIDSVLMYNVDSQLEYRMVGDQARGGRFVMPDSTLFVYVYAHKLGDYHTVTYRNANGDTLQHSDWHQVGDTVRYSGSTPTLDSETDRFRWQFIGWTPAVHPVAGDDVYTATYRRYVRLDETICNDTVVAAYAGEVVGVDMVRKVDPRYFSFVSFPFDMTAEQMYHIWGWNTVAWELSYSEFDEMDNTHLDVYFTPAGEPLQAGHPYILMSGYANDSIVLDSVVLRNVQDTVRTEHLEFRANTINPYWMPEHNYLYRFPIKNKMYWSGTASGPYRALRAYMYLLFAANAHTNVVLHFDGIDDDEDYNSDGSADPGAEEKQGDMPTFFESVEGDAVVGAEKLLHNHQVLIRRDDRIYDILGQRVR